MLRNLHVRNVAVVDDLEVEFGPGLNVITGETGSGKSILIDSVGLLIGERASTESIRTGENKATVSGIFELPLENPAWQAIQTMGADQSESGELLIRREISTTGSGKAQLNGSLVTSSFLKQIGQYLVEIHGQHDTRLLLQPRYHLELLDAFHGDNVLLGEVAAFSKQISKLHEEAHALAQDEHARLQRLDLLNFQIQEIDQAGPKSGEEPLLNDERQVLANSEKLYQLSRQGYEQLYEAEDSVVNTLNRLAGWVAELATIDHRLEKVADSLKNAIYQLEDSAYFLRDYSGSVEYNQNRFDEIESRLTVLDRLKRKYGATIDEVLTYFLKIQTEREKLLHSDIRKSEIEKQLDTLKTEYRARANTLSQLRIKAGEEVEKKMASHLSDLAMGSTRFKVGLQTDQTFVATGESGLDQVEFLVSPNIGEELRPMRKIASGGELSRLALALRLVLRSDRQVALVFDEVDSGIGGGVAEMVGRKLKRVAALNQTFCVTHVPQIAAIADHHFRVDKLVEKGKTFTRISRLSEEERVEELARMTGGVTITDITRRHARQLLKQMRSDSH